MTDNLRRIGSEDDAHERFEVDATPGVPIAGVWVLAGEAGRATARRMAAAAVPRPEAAGLLWRWRADRVLALAWCDRRVRMATAIGLTNDQVAVEVHTIAALRRELDALELLLDGLEPEPHPFTGGALDWSRTICIECGRGADAHLASMLAENVREGAAERGAAREGRES